MVFDEITLSVSVFFSFIIIHKRKISTSLEGGDPFGFCSKFRTLWVVCFLIQYKLRARRGFELWVNMAHPLQPIWLHPPCFGCVCKVEMCLLFLQVVGWRLIVGEGGLKLQCLWKLKDYQCGVELINRIYKVVDSAGHFPNLHLEQPNQVRAELWTSSIGKTSYYNVFTFF